MASQHVLRIGTRGSPLALAQAREVKARLLAAHEELGADGIELVTIQTSGDQIIDRPLAEVGGKGLFTKEIEESLITGRIDLAVHSMKDMETLLPQGLMIGCLLERVDPRDGFLSPKAGSLADLPPGALIGTASLRRRAQILAARPDLRVESLRGNVQTRLRKLAEGVVDATLLAVAGLRRLGLEDKLTSIIETRDMLPAVAQGVIGIETREADQAVAALLAPLNHEPTAVCIAAERAFLAALDGSCRTPIAGLARLLEDGSLHFQGQILRPDGSQSHEITAQGKATDAAELGRAAGETLRGRAGPGFFDQTG